MKTLALFLSIIFSLSAQAQYVIDFDSNLVSGWPVETILVRNAFIVSAGCSNNYLELRGHGQTAGYFRFGPIPANSQGQTISFYICDSQPGNSGKVDVVEYNSPSASSNPINTTRYNYSNTGTCPNGIDGAFIVHTIISNSTTYIEFQKATGSSVELRIDNISSMLSLPVELVSFSGYITTNKIVLQWKTKTESNNFGFEIQRKTNDNWDVIGFVSGHGTSNAPHDYSFVDNLKTNMSSEFRYRLVQTDRDGTSSISNELVFSSDSPVENTMFVYPNPLKANTSATLTPPNTSQSICTILRERQLRHSLITST